LWWTPPSFFAERPGGRGYVDLSIVGTFVAGVTLQRSFDEGVTWQDVAEFTDPIEQVVEYPNNGIMLRLGIKDGNYTSGTITVRLSQAS
jgi:hypothetical protein